ncbi:MAG: hypothetical protein JRC87_00775 [Deltaproteobacteria bacterium]|nr:hypothetical protein [Deltaproteobacteria bacterium]
MILPESGQPKSFMLSHDARRHLPDFITNRHKRQGVKGSEEENKEKKEELGHGTEGSAYPSGWVHD